MEIVIFRREHIIHFYLNNDFADNELHEREICFALNTVTFFFAFKYQEQHHQKQIKKLNNKEKQLRLEDDS